MKLISLIPTNGTDASIAAQINAIVDLLPPPSDIQTSIAFPDSSVQMGESAAVFVSAWQGPEFVDLANQLTYAISSAPGPLTAAALQAQIERVQEPQGGMGS